MGMTLRKIQSIPVLQSFPHKKKQILFHTLTEGYSSQTEGLIYVNFNWRPGPWGKLVTLFTLLIKTIAIEFTGLQWRGELTLLLLLEKNQTSKMRNTLPITFWHLLLVSTIPTRSPVWWRNYTSVVRFTTMPALPETIWCAGREEIYTESKGVYRIWQELSFPHLCYFNYKIIALAPHSLWLANKYFVSFLFLPVAVQARWHRERITVITSFIRQVNKWLATQSTRK